MAVNNPNVGTSNNYITTMDPLFDTFDITESIFKRYGDQFAAAYMMVRKMGAMKPAVQDNFYHFEDYRFTETIVVDANATAAGPGQNLTFVLDAVSVGPNGESYARPYWNIVFPDNFVEGTIRTVTVTGGPTVTIVVTPKDPTVTLSVTAGQQLFLGAPNFGEGTNQPRGLSPKFLRRDFTLQILKEAYAFSGDAATDEAAVDVAQYASDFGDRSTEFLNVVNSLGVGNSFTRAGMVAMDIRHAAQVAQMIYWGQPNTNTVTPIIDTDPLAIDGVVRATQGLYPTIQTGGFVNNYTAGSWSLTDYDACGDYLKSQNVSALQPVCHLLGYVQQVEIENALISSNAATYTKYTSDVANKQIFAGNSKSMNLSYVEVTKAGYTYAQVLEPIFSDPTQAGAPGYNAKNLGFLFPLAQGKDPKTREMLNSINLRYKKLGGINRAYSVWARTQQITNYDIYEVEMQAHLGLQIFGRNQMIIMEGL